MAILAFNFFYTFEKSLKRMPYSQLREKKDNWFPHYLFVWEYVVITRNHKKCRFNSRNGVGVNFHWLYYSLKLLNLFWCRSETQTPSFFTWTKRQLTYPIRWCSMGYRNTVLPGKCETKTDKLALNTRLRDSPLGRTMWSNRGSRGRRLCGALTQMTGLL